MIRFLYSCLFYCIFPIVLLRLLWRSIKAPAYRQRMAERLACFSSKGLADASANLESSIMVHAVSVGEMMVAVALIRSLLSRNPKLRFLLTTTTPTGSALSQQRLAAEIKAQQVYQVYLPYDLPGVIRRFIRRMRPRLLIIVETELWPNLIANCAQQQIPSVLINARLSAKSARGYERFSALIRPMLNQLSAVLAQSDEDAQRFKNLGLSASKVEVMGSIKFDIKISAAQRQQASQYRQRWLKKQSRSVIIAASTHPVEHQKIFDAFQLLLQQYSQFDSRESSGSYAKPLLLIAPRHPEQFAVVAKLAQKNFNTQRLSESTLESKTEVLVVDTLGELVTLYGAADIAFVGGSLIERGGHNVLEAAAWGLPIICGSSYYNFKGIVDGLLAAGALHLVADSDQLAAVWLELLQQPTIAQQQGALALDFYQAQQGALQKSCDYIENILGVPLH